MPTNVYLNEGAADLSVAGNYTPAAVPVAGDSFFAVVGSQAVNAGLTALSGFAMVRVFISSGFRGTFGTAGSPVTFGNLTSFDLDGGGGQHYFATGTTTTLRVAGSAGGKVWISAGTFTTVVVFRGEVEFSGACTVTKLIVLGGTVTLRKLTSGAAGTTIIVKGGTVVNERSVGTLEILGASGTVTSLYSAAVTTKLRIFGGRYYHNSDGTITALEGGAGLLSTSGSQKTFTVTNAELYDGFTLDDSADLSYITWTNAPVLYGYKGGGVLR